MGGITVAWSSYWIYSKYLAIISKLVAVEQRSADRIQNTRTTLESEKLRA
jgi:hypothetical protein